MSGSGTVRRLAAGLCWLAGVTWAAELHPVALRVAGQLSPFANGWNLAEGRELSGPRGVAFDGTHLYVADTQNHRVLAWRDGGRFSNGAAADLVIGQPDRFGTAPNSPTQARGLSQPSGLAVDRAGNLWIADTGNHRLVRYPRPFEAWVQALDQVLDSATISMAAPLAVALSPREELVVADTGNNRVLFFGGASPAVLEVSNPTALAFDAAGRLYVASGVSNRVYQFPPALEGGAAPLRILGGNGDSARRAAGTLLRPAGLAVAGEDLFVADAGNHRILRFSGLTRSLDPRPVADAVFGQPDFVSGSPNGGSRQLPLPSARSLAAPGQLAVGPNGDLLIADAGNHRVLALPASFQEASRVVGQDTFARAGANLLEGREISTCGAIAVDATTTPPHVYIADTGNHRILGWRDLRSLREGARADLVIGQPDLFTAVANYGAAAADNRPATAVNLNRPAGLAVDAGGNLYVADSGNHRVLRFPRPFEASSLRADLILGHPSGGTSNYLMNQPTGIAVHPERGDLLVADTMNHRVLYFPAPLVSGMAAARVLGGRGLSSAEMNQPAGVAFDADDHIYVADPGNSRVLVFGPIGELPAAGAAALASGVAPVGQPDFVSSAGATAINRLRNPAALTVNWSNGELWVADTGNHRVLRFPPLATLTVNGGAAYAAGGLIGQTSFTGRTPNLGAPAPGLASAAGLNLPSALALDGTGNLLVADANARVLLYFPQAVSVSAATYLTGAPLAPGMLASLFGADLAGETHAAARMPLATTLGGVQVLVEETAVPLLYVSPSQINYQVPWGLEPGALARVQVVRAATGRVAAGGTLLVAPAAVGIFGVLNQDGALNSASHPAARGSLIQIFATGQGAVRHSPPDGAPAPSEPLAETPQRPLVTIGTSSERDVAPEFSGLAPGFVGLWQINARVPEITAPGPRTPVLVRYGGAASNVIYINVR